MKLCKDWQLNWGQPTYCAQVDWAREHVWTTFVTCNDLQTEWYVVQRYMDGPNGVDIIETLSTHGKRRDAMRTANSFTATVPKTQG